MRIGINAFPLRTDGGGARYVFSGLLRALLRHDSTHQYIIFAHPDGMPLVNKVLVAAGHAPGNWPESRVRLERILDEGQIYAYRSEFDLYFGPLNNLNPRVYDRPTVALLHDIQEQYLPENFSKAELVARREVYPEICHSATILVAISEFCKRSFIEKFDVDPRKIEVVHNAPQPELIDGEPAEGVWTKEALPENYFFYPANCYKHKNHQLLLDAIEQMRAQRDVPPVIFSGFELPGGYPLRKEIAARGLDEICRVYTDLPADEMRYLYRHALAVVLPTTFEGFCMPAIEAMACGVPVVCSELPVLREILGDNALYFDPQNAEQLVSQIRRIQNEPALRKQMIAAGPGIAVNYNWDKSAKLILEIFREARQRFTYGYHLPTDTTRPRIGISLRLTEGSTEVIRTVQSMLAESHKNLLIRCVVDRPLDPAARGFLEASGVKVVEPGEHAVGSLADLRQFAQDEDLDIVGEVIEGNRLKPSAMDSLTWSHLTAPEKSVYLGECFQWRGDHFVGVSRLRLTGDGLWKMEGLLYPEALFINPRTLRNGASHVGETNGNGVEEWRWDLLREARYSGQLFLTRRTMADCDQATLGPKASKQAARAGMFNYYNVSNDRSVKVRLMRRVEPVVKRAARVLPMKWQDAGTRIWYHISR